MSLVLGTGSGGGGGAPTDAQYVVLVANATLTQERVLTGSANEIVVTDGGAGGAVTLTAGSLIVQTDQANTFTTGTQTINTGAAGTVGLVVKAAAGQTAARQQWQSSTGNVDLAVLANGDVFTDRWLAQDSNTFVGVGVAGAGNLAHTALVEGWENTALGYRAARALTTGYANTIAGYQAGIALTTGYNNVALGSKALSTATTAYSNMAIGTETLRDNNSTWNVAIGPLAMLQATGTQNMAVGAFSLALCSGARNTGIGYFVGYRNTGNDNIYIGKSAAENQTTGSNNVIIGNEAGKGVGAYAVSGQVLIGYQSGFNETNPNRLYIANSSTTTPLIYGQFSGAGAGVTIHSQNTDGVPLTVKGIAAQASNLQNWETSAGVALMEVEATGVVDYRWAMGDSTKDPTTDAPADWVQVKIGGVTRFLAAYAA